MVIFNQNFEDVLDEVRELIPTLDKTSGFPLFVRQKRIVIRKDGLEDLVKYVDDFSELIGKVICNFVDVDEFDATIIVQDSTIRGGTFKLFMDQLKAVIDMIGIKMKMASPVKELDQKRDNRYILFIDARFIWVDVPENDETWVELEEEEEAEDDAEPAEEPVLTDEELDTELSAIGIPPVENRDGSTIYVPDTPKVIEIAKPDAHVDKSILTPVTIDVDAFDAAVTKKAVPKLIVKAQEEAARRRALNEEKKNDAKRQAKNQSRKNRKRRG